MSKREGFWRGSDRNLEAIGRAVPKPEWKDSPSTLLRALLPRTTERHPVTAEPRTLLWSQAKQLLTMTERIHEARATTSASDIIGAGFTDSSFDLMEVAGRHEIEIADQASCAAGLDPLSGH